MIQFNAAPAIPIGYHRLGTLTGEEIESARSAGYVVDVSDPSDSAVRDGLDNYAHPPTGSDILNWRVRMYILWFCYIYENLRLIRKPLGAFEEIILEFKAPGILDLPGRRLGTLLAGAGAADPPSPPRDLEYILETLEPHYDKAIRLLERFQQAHNE